jgi:RNA:NAD 2'-phosphotransferase (TPT1/KptA family)
MKRDHIHLSPISAVVPPKAEVLIFMDAIGMLEMGMPMWKAGNGVWLTSGWDGMVDPSFFVSHEVVQMSRCPDVQTFGRPRDALHGGPLVCGQ